MWSQASFILFLPWACHVNFSRRENVENKSLLYLHGGWEVFLAMSQSYAKESTAEASISKGDWEPGGRIKWEMKSHRLLATYTPRRSCRHNNPWSASRDPRGQTTGQQPCVLRLRGTSGTSVALQAFQGTAWPGLGWVSENMSSAPSSASCTRFMPRDLVFIIISG